MSLSSFPEPALYGHPSAGMPAVIQAAKDAGIHDFIEGLPTGYQTPVGERGIALSEGQRQRIGIARALLKEPDIILMDEPTSAQDGQTGKSLLLSLPLLLKGKTVIVVCCHPELLTRADRVFLLRGTRLEAIGTHAELMSQNPDYASLVMGGA